MLAHRLVEEPTLPVNWGGRAISLDEIEEGRLLSEAVAIEEVWDDSALSVFHVAEFGGSNARPAAGYLRSTSATHTSATRMLSVK